MRALFEYAMNIDAGAEPRESNNDEHNPVQSDCAATLRMPHSMSATNDLVPVSHEVGTYPTSTRLATHR